MYFRDWLCFSNEPLKGLMSSLMFKFCPNHFSAFSVVVIQPVTLKGRKKKKNLSWKKILKWQAQWREGISLLLHHRFGWKKRFLTVLLNNCRGGRGHIDLGDNLVWYRHHYTENCGAGYNVKKSDRNVSLHLLHVMQFCHLFV